jgi:hypothetical protein
MVLPELSADGAPAPQDASTAPPFTRATQTDLTDLLTFRDLPPSLFLTRLTVGHLNLYAHLERRPHTATELAAFRDAARAGTSAYWATKIPLDLAALALCAWPYRRLPRRLRFLPKTLTDKPVFGFAPRSTQHGIVLATFRLSLFFCATGVSAIPAMWRFQTVAMREEAKDPRLTGCVTMQNLRVEKAQLDGFVEAVKEGRVAYKVREDGGAGGLWGWLGGSRGEEGRGEEAPGWAKRTWEARDGEPAGAEAYDDASPVAPADDGWTVDGRQRAESETGGAPAAARPSSPPRDPREVRPSWTPGSDGPSPVDELLAPQPPDRPSGGSASSSSSGGPPTGSWAAVREAARQQRRADGSSDGQQPRREDAWAARRRGEKPAGAAAEEGGLGGAGGSGGGAAGQRGGVSEEQKDFERRMARERQGRDSDAGERRRW